MAGGSSDEPVKDMRRRLASILLLSVPLAVYLTVFGSGLERLLWGPAAGGARDSSYCPGGLVPVSTPWPAGSSGSSGPSWFRRGILLGAGVAFAVVGAWGQDSAGMLLLVAMVALPVAGGLVR